MHTHIHHLPPPSLTHIHHLSTRSACHDTPILFVAFFVHSDDKHHDRAELEAGLLRFVQMMSNEKQTATAR